MNLRRTSSLLFALAILGIVGLLIVGGSTLRSEGALHEAQGELDLLERRFDAFSARSDALLFDPLSDEDLASYVTEARELQAALRTWSDVATVDESAVRALGEMIVLTREHANLEATVGEATVDADPNARARKMAELGLILDDTTIALSQAFRTVRNDTQRRSLIVLAIAVAAFAALTLMLAALLRWRVSAPLTEIARTAQRVSFGDAVARAHVGRLPELAQLAAALNAALDRRDDAQARSAERNRQLDLYASRLVDAQEIAHLGSFHAESPDGAMTVSDELLRIAGVDSGTFVTTFDALVQLVVPEDRLDLRQAHAAAWSGESVGPFDVRVRRPNGKLRSVQFRARPSFGPEGQVEAIEGTVLDVTDVTALERELQDERRLNEIGSRLARVGGWSVDGPTLAPTWSSMVSEIYETPPGYVPPIEEGLSYYAPASRPAIQEAFERLVSHGEPYDIEVQLDTAKGRRIWVRTVGRPRRDATGTVTGYEGAIQDVDARRRTEEALDEERRVSAMAGRVGRVGGWSLALASGEHAWSEIVFDIHGLPRGRVVSPEEGLAMYAPTSRPIIEEAFGRLVDEGEPYDLELELDTADGRRIWVRTVAQPVYDENDNLVGAEGAFQDIDARKRNEERLERTDRRLRQMLEALPDGFLAVDPDGHPVFANEASRHLLSGDRPLNGDAVWELLPEPMRSEIGSQVRTAVTTPTTATLVAADPAKDRWLEVAVGPAGDQVAVLVRDVSERERLVDQVRAHEAELIEARDALERALDVQAKLMNTLPAQVALLDSDGTIVEVNEQWREFGRENGAKDASFGVGLNYIAVSRDARGLDAETAHEVAQGLGELLDGERTDVSIEYPCHAPHRKRWFQLEARATTSGGELQAVLMHVDVTDYHEAQERLESIAFQDPLTGLLNRIGLLNELEAYLDEEWLEDYLLVELDLRDMSSVNDIHGFHAGDALMKSVAERLARPTDAHSPIFVARTGGDEFVFLIGPNPADERDEEQVGDRAVSAARALIEETMGPSHAVSTKLNVKIDAHAGFTRLASLPRPAEDLLREAHLALFEGRTVATLGWSEYSRNYEDEVRARRRLSDELQVGIERGELRLHFHPTVDTRTGSLSSAEALVRWQHPERGLLPPGAFIPAAESTGLIVPLGQWVLNEACRKMAVWRDSLHVTRIAVNASAEELVRASYADDVLAALERHDLDPTMLTIEVTETALVRDADLAAKHLHALQEAGVRLALDDFGTGYASLGILKNFPFEHVKIDRLFISDMLTDSYSHGVIDSILTLAKTIGATVIAEGVETEEQRQALVELGCEIAQGYYFCLPLAEEDFEWLLQTRPSLPLGRASP